MSTCSFCSSSDSERTYVEGEGAYICSACIEVMYEMVIKQGIKTKADLDSIQGGNMTKASLEFQIKRGVADCEGLDDDTLEVVEKCLKLCKKKDYEKAVATILPILNFEWIWGNCDGDPSEIFESTDDISFDLNPDNSIVKVGESDGSLVITATVCFEVDVKAGVTQEEVSEWLSDNSAYACGYVGAGWVYTESDGDNVWVTKLG